MMTIDREPAPEPVTRVQQNFLAAPERRLLNWLCARLPAWMTPDVLTLIGVAGAGAVCAGYGLSDRDEAWLWLAVAGYAINWFGDSLDGSIARFRKVERPRYGYFVDHSCDGLATLLILGGMGLSPFVRMDVALIALAGYLLLSIHAFLSAKVIGELKLSHVGAGPTELRLVLIALTLSMMAWGGGPPLVGGLTGFDLFIGGTGTALIILFIVQTMATARRLAALDRLGPR